MIELIKDQRKSQETFCNFCRFKTDNDKTPADLVNV